MAKALMSGNEAVARGFWEYGGHVACAYPGTPSTEILENIAKYDDIYCQWNSNEKTALETAAGSCVGGARTIVTMKHVGLNVAADPLMTMAYTGVNGGFIIVSADDPGMHSSQNEQDNRRFAMFAKIPVLNPSDSSEAKEFVKLGFELSELFDTPVILRLTTRICHSKTIVELGDRQKVEIKDYIKNTAKNLVMPANARKLHLNLEKRLKTISEYSNTSPLNNLALKDGPNGKIGIVASGIAVQYAKELFPEASFLKIGMDFPFPKQLAHKLNDHCDSLIVCEELEPVLEEQLVLEGIKVTGKEKIPICGELNQQIIADSLGIEIEKSEMKLDAKLPSRPPVLCPGCSHRPLFMALKKLKVTVTGDIGCYTLGALPPLDAMDTCICMGASITQGLGFELARGKDFSKKSVAVIGDSTFMHSGMTGLLDVVYNKAHSTVIILDNCITAMTGHQDNAATGKTLMKNSAPAVDIKKICQALGVKKIETIRPYNPEKNMELIKECLEFDGPAVIIAKAPCILIKQHKKTPALEVDPNKCKKCGACIRTGCPAVSRAPEGHAYIDPLMCAGEVCSLCATVCKFDAHIKRN